MFVVILNTEFSSWRSARLQSMAVFEEILSVQDKNLGVQACDPF
jgi:hypothetical protein